MASASVQSSSSAGQKSVYKPPPPVHLSFGKNLIAGGAAGLIELCCMHPLDVLKTRLQLQGKERMYGNTMSEAARRIVQLEGPLAFYKGILPPMMYEIPKRATKFAAFEFYKKMLVPVGQPTFVMNTVCGTMAGCTEALVVSPFEVVKIALQADNSSRKSGSPPKYTNTMDCAVKLVKSEGSGVFFKGITSTLYRNGVFNGVFFAVNARAKQAWPFTLHSRSDDIIRTISCGFIAGVAATSANTPFDVVKTKIQNQPLPKPGVVSRYRGVFQGMTVIVKEEGFKGLYKGYLPKVMRLGPGGAIMFLVFDLAAEVLK